ncbi:CPCC family cysteine-rich protein [Microbacterium sp. BH-3-3-3]|uniref:CPCC family cysteine-rich protein n=1 Tax=Microbacterium sp. BH-3-3-3 TaxID=1906742 RepID=UPI0037C787F0
MDGDRQSSHGRLFPCVCRGYVTLSQRDDSYEICSVCFWEDENSARRWPRDPSGGQITPLSSRHIAISPLLKPQNNGSDSWYGLPATAPYASPGSARLIHDATESNASGSEHGAIGRNSSTRCTGGARPTGCGQADRVPPVHAATTRPPCWRPRGLGSSPTRFGCVRFMGGRCRNSAPR